MAPEATKVEIGLGIGQVITARLDEDGLRKLRNALKNGDDWHELRTDEETLVINLKTVVFLRVEDQSHSIGFAGS
jgi:hypothetical protein